MRGRSRGHQERIILLAHQIEAMARHKILQPASHYLRKASVNQPADGAGTLLAKLRMMKAKQDAAKAE